MKISRSSLVTGATVGLVQIISCCSILAKPRVPLAPLIPEIVPPIWREGFDDAFWLGYRDSTLAFGGFSLTEDWSGYALQRGGFADAPFVVPAVDATGYTNITCNRAGAIRFVFNPGWSSSSVAGGTGPGAEATLLQLDMVDKQGAMEIWALRASANGSRLNLTGQSDAGPAVLLQADIAWLAKVPHLVVLNYSPQGTALFVDGALVVEGAGTVAVPANVAALTFGSTITGTAQAYGDFDELGSFNRPLSEAEVAFYFNAVGDLTRLGPLTAQEMARAQALAARRAQNSSLSRSASMLRSAGGALAGRQSCGPLDTGACPTNSGPVYFTNVWAVLETNGTVTILFDLVGGGGNNGLFYDIYTTTNLDFGQWTFLARSHSCSANLFTNQPGAAAFYRSSAPHDNEGENRIQTENVITGTTNWMLFNPITVSDSHGWPTNNADTLPEIQGFASATSVNVGDTIDLYVDVRATNNPEATNFTLEIFRLGWYNWQGGRKMTWTDSGQPTNTMTLPSHKQPVPPMNITNGLVDCLSGVETNGTFNTNLIWQRSYTLTVPTNWVSGVYVARLTTGTDVTPQTTGKQSYIIFIVREDGRTSEYLYQASVTTWQAYNGWGGSSAYPYPHVQQCHVAISNAVDFFVPAVSFNRPYAQPTCDLVNYHITYGLGAGDFLTENNKTAWEYNTVRWLERQGYDVAYSTSVDTHRNCPANKGVKAWLSVGHDEYWSVPMRSHVEETRDRGVNLCFFGANVCFWKIDFDANQRAFTVDKTDGNHDQWRSPTINNHEASLIGEEFMSAANGDMQMPTNFPSGSGIGGVHWAYDYSSLTNGQLLPGLLGYEADGWWDMNLCTCYQAASPLSPHPASNTVILADSPMICYGSLGCVPTNGAPPLVSGHSYITLYSACNGAQVFAAGTMQWAWGLDNFPFDPGYPSGHSAHAGAQQMTHNVLRVFAGKATAPVIFTNADSATSGNWTNRYGTNYIIADSSMLTNLPAYAQITFSNQQAQVWSSQATDSRALLVPPYYTNRIAAAWTTGTNQNSDFSIDLNLTDTNKHTVALYCVDWLNTGTVSEKVEVFDYTDTSHALDTRYFQLPPNGVYLVWNLKGHYILRVTKPDSISENKAMVSGLFIGP